MLILDMFYGIAEGQLDLWRRTTHKWVSCSTECWVKFPNYAAYVSENNSHSCTPHVGFSPLAFDSFCKSLHEKKSCKLNSGFCRLYW